MDFVKNTGWIAWIGFSYFNYHNSLNNLSAATALVEEASQNAHLVIVSVHGTITDVQKRAVRSVFMAAGASEVVLIEGLVLAAVGGVVAYVAGGR